MRSRIQLEIGSTAGARQNR